MSPLKITMLMRLYCRAKPFDDMPVEQVNAPVMHEAFAFFRRHDLLAVGVSWVTVKYERIGHPFLSPCGQQFVDRLCEVEP